MKLKQKEIFIEKKHQELDAKEERAIREFDQLAQNEHKLCQILTATPMEILPGKTNRTNILSDISLYLDESLVKRIERLQDYLRMLEKIKVWIYLSKIQKNELILDGTIDYYKISSNSIEYSIDST